MPVLIKKHIDKMDIKELQEKIRKADKDRGWKYFLNKLSKEIRLKITVLHFPPATSKWNKIEHRMFSFISLNWKGQPLTDYEVIINFIKNTTTEKGLEIFARLDKNKYEKGKKFSDGEIENINIRYHHSHPEWNYTISSN